MPATFPLIESCTREYQDWMEERLTPEGDERPAPEEHFVWLSKDYTPHDNDLGSPFIPLDFTLGLPSIRDWPHRAGEPSWILDPEECPKPVRKVPVDSTRASSMDEGKTKKKKKKKKKKKNIVVPRNRRNRSLKQPTGAREPTLRFGPMLDLPKTPVQARTLNPMVDSGLGSNPSIQPRRGTDTESWQGVALRLSLDATREPVEDDPLSDRGGGDEDQDMARC